jgi:hypothetical protein
MTPQNANPSTGSNSVIRQQLMHKNRSLFLIDEADRNYPTTAKH